MARPPGPGLPTVRDSSDPEVQRRLQPLFPQLVSGASILDLGCGNGAFCSNLASRGLRVVGLEFDRKRAASAAHEVTIVQGDASRLPIGDTTLDAVLVNEVLEHVPSEHETLTEILRVLKPEGLLYLYAPNKWFPFETHGMRLGSTLIRHSIPGLSMAPAFVRRRFENARIYSALQLAATLTDHGFIVLHRGYVYPSFARVRPVSLRRALARASRALECSPLSVLGLSVFLIAKRPA